MPPRRSSSASAKPSPARSQSFFSKFSLGDKVTFVWFCIDAFTHLTIELGYLYLALTTTAKESDSFLAKIWKEYSRADSRWEVRDEGIISVEMATVFVGLLCLVQLWALASNKPYRHALQIVICVAELYGGWMTFAPEWFAASPNKHLNASDWKLLWIYLVFMNGLWVVVPLVLLWDSWSQTTLVIKGARPAALPAAAWYATAALIGLYMVLVPAVLGTTIKF
jgi:hypothetical protein